MLKSLLCFIATVNSGVEVWYGRMLLYPKALSHDGYIRTNAACGTVILRFHGVSTL